VARTKAGEVLADAPHVAGQEGLGVPVLPRIDGLREVDHAEGGFQLGFIEHGQNSGEPFSEFGTGLDHIEFEVSSHEELEQWRDRLDALGIPHSGIKDDHLIVVRDPDNIQFEFFLPLP
jgi:glyoxylase I family protein